MEETGMAVSESRAVMQAVDMTPMSMLEKAVSSGADVAVLERLLDLQERYEANNARRAFTDALSRFRQNMPAILKTESAYFGPGKASYRYEDLGKMAEQLSPALAAVGLSFRWRTNPADAGTVSVTCVVSHCDGHSEEATLCGPVDQSGGKNAIQAIGSVTTYLQRYTLKTALGVAASADDDGNQGRAQAQQQAQNQKAQQQDKAMVTQAQLDRFGELLDWAEGAGYLKEGQAQQGKDWAVGKLSSIVGVEIGRWKKQRDEHEKAAGKGDGDEASRAADSFDKAESGEKQEATDAAAEDPTTGSEQPADSETSSETASDDTKNSTRKSKGKPLPLSSAKRIVIAREAAGVDVNELAALCADRHGTKDYTQLDRDEAEEFIAFLTGPDLSEALRQVRGQLALPIDKGKE